MSINVWGWILFGLGTLIAVIWGYTLTQDRHRAPGRHSADQEKPLDQSEDWRSVRMVAATTLIVLVLFTGMAAKHSNPLHSPVQSAAIGATIIVLAWEIRSWGKITDPAARKRVRNKARLFYVPVAFQLLSLLRFWDGGLRKIVVIAALALIMVGPDVEPVIRRWLQRRAGGTTTS